MSRELQLLQQELQRSRSHTVLRKDFFNYMTDLNKVVNPFITDVKKQAEKHKKNKVTLLAILRN